MKRKIFYLPEQKAELDACLAAGGKFVVGVGEMTTQVRSVELNRRMWALHRIAYRMLIDRKSVQPIDNIDLRDNFMHTLFILQFVPPIYYTTDAYGTIIQPVTSVMDHKLLVGILTDYEAYLNANGYHFENLSGVE